MRHKYSSTTTNENFQKIVKSTSFAKQQVQYNDFILYFPPGFEKPFLVFYIVFLPYIAGLLFLLVYVAKGDLEVFSSFSSNYSFMFSWCIGYECLAALALLLIAWKAFSFNKTGKNSK